MTELLEQMIQEKRLSKPDAELFQKSGNANEELNEVDVLQWLASEYQVSFTQLEEVDLDRELLSLFPARILLKEELLPLSRENGSVKIATSRLFATQGLDTLKSLTGLKMIPVLAPSDVLQREIKKRLGVGADTIDTLKEDTAFQVVDEEAEEGADLDGAAEDASIIRFVNQVLGDAIGLRATDIHLEPFEHELQIRYRVDGVLQEVPVPAEIKRFQPAIVFAEKRLPQDGRIKLKVNNSEVDVRVSIIPMLHGEAVVLRLLRQDGSIRGLAEMGLGSRELEMFRHILTLPHGIFLVTGPTGSGKTTTLYTALSEINDSVRKIITIEDPIEYQIRGINQIQVSEKAGLRHDPDVLLIGEIRDQETARIAVQASLTGHLVFSTLHTNDAPSSLTRLVDMGLEPYLVASSLEGVLAQRLVRVLCPHCKETDTSSRALAMQSEMKLPEGLNLFRAVGCQECRQTGYHGRRAVFEMMDLDYEIRQMVLKSCSSVELKEAMRRKGLNTLHEDGRRLIREGITTIDEVMRVTKKDETLNGE